MPKVAAYMKANNVTRLIVLQFEKSLPRDDDERKTLIENFRKYQGQIYRFCVLFAKDVTSKEDAVKALKRSGKI